MDEDTLASLRVALAASPGNIELLALVAGALVDRDQAEEAAKLVRDAGLDSFVRPAHKRVAARALSKAGDLDSAFQMIEADEDPETSMLRARILHELGRPKEAVKAYQ